VGTGNHALQLPAWMPNIPIACIGTSECSACFKHVYRRGLGRFVYGKAMQLYCRYFHYNFHLPAPLWAVLQGAGVGDNALGAGTFSQSAIWI